MEQSDKQLLERFLQNGDESAFETIVKRYGSLVMGVCQRVTKNSHDAEDVFQATFLKLASKARELGELHKEQPLGGWLYQVAYRQALDMKSKAFKRYEEIGEMDTIITEPSGNETWAQLRPMLDEELSRLPDKLRWPLVLCYLEGRTYEDAADYLGLAHSKLKNRLSQGRDILRDRLTRRGIVLSSTLLGTLLLENASSAPSSALISTTVKAVASIGPSTILSVSIFQTLKGIIRSLLCKKAIVTAGIVVVSGLTVLLIIPRSSKNTGKSNPKEESKKQEFAAIRSLSEYSIQTHKIAQNTEIKQDGEFLTFTDDYGNQAFLEAAKHRKFETLKSLLAQGADVNTRDKDGKTALMLSAKIWSSDAVTLKILNLLLDAGADINARDNSGQTVLMEWVLNHMESPSDDTNDIPEIIKLFVSRGVNLNSRNGNEQTALSIAMNKAYKKWTDALINAGANPEGNFEGLTNLMYAAQTGDNILPLLESEDVNAKTKKGWTALMYAVKCNQIEIVKTLIERGADINTQTQDGLTALMEAVYKDVDVHMHRTDSNGGVSIDFSQKYEPILMKILLENGAEINVKNKEGWTALMIASTVGNAENTRLLLDYGADVNATNTDGWTALMYAAYWHKKEKVSLLLEKGADINLKNKNNETALKLAMRKGRTIKEDRTHTIDLLKRAGAQK